MAAADADNNNAAAAAAFAAVTAWHPLPLPALPALLVSARVAASSYVVRLTDMANVWEESLDGDGICARSMAENTSIDPSDTPENMARFLDSLVSALDPLRPGHGDTSLCLTPVSGRDNDGDDDDDGLVLTVTCPLTGFKPLTWPIHLTKCPPSAVATHLVLPLFRSHDAGQVVIESLVQALGHKDAAIAKMADKLEALGTGLEQVFPSLLGRSKVTRSAAGGKVKGLAPFDRAQLGLGSDSARLDIALGDGQESLVSGWWRDFGKSRKQMCRDDAASLPLSAKATVRDGDDEFQVQATPPGLRTSTAAPSIPSEDNHESLIPDSYPTAFAPPTHHVPEEPTSPGLGTVGGSTTAPPKARGPETAVDDSETASEDDDATASAGSDACPSPLAAKATATTDVKRGGIGSIGGKRAVDERPGAHGTSEAASPRKVGVIGGIGGSSPSKPSVRSPPSKPSKEEIDRGRSAKVSNEVRETSQERADRRREEIKRDLERKAASGPARKKRRF
ncbi:hypothetical protein CP532_1380 [Ophiocordyceps camponoti-leonardi (nom. inval.)]|nr:hypothetical protein CP532_1380 [Ophiocordyceps camponoti-leonardi (nom. inval.)]